MKICLVHEEYPEETNFGGIATYQKNLAEELVKNNNVVIVICRGIDKNQHYFENGVEIYRVLGKKFHNQILEYIYYRKKVSKILNNLQKQNQIDIIETPDWGAETIFFYKKRNVPLVVRLHTPLKVWLKYNNNNFGRITSTMLQWEDNILKSCDYISCCSNALKKIIVKDFNINENLINVNPNPANIKKFFYDKKIKKENILLFVGSLEERKGVCILAKALNNVLSLFPELKVMFIGKDTNRNKYNISTEKLIKNILKKKYHKNILFLGQKSNSELNYYFNLSTIGVFPSLFDNFPYVVLEAMSTGLNVIGSSNSGMTEMIDNADNIYKTGSVKDLSKKIISIYNYSKTHPVNFHNIKIVNEKFSSKKVCNDIYKEYESIIEKYDKTTIKKEDLKNVLNSISIDKIIRYGKINNGVANIVYLVKTRIGNYIVKKYLHNYNFELSEKLYNLYDENKIKCIRPVNKKPIYYDNYYYNVFPYKKNQSEINKDNIYNLFNSIITCKKEIQNNIFKTLSERVKEYSNYLENKKNLNKSTIYDVKYVLKVFNTIKNDELFKKSYLNHGDISKTNIIYNNRSYYIIDFDECCIANELYDFSVIAVKFFENNNRFLRKDLKRLITLVKDHMPNYTIYDYYNSIKYYLCKILLEKFYLYEKNEINLYDKTQRKDYFKKYIYLLEDLDIIGRTNEK